MKSFSVLALSFALLFSVTASVFAASGSSGTAVVPSPSSKLEVNISPAVVTAGQWSTLTWSGSNVLACFGNNGVRIPNNATSGTMQRLINAPSSVRITCMTPSGKKISKTVTWKIKGTYPKLVVKISPSEVIAGESTTLTWSGSNVEQCFLIGSENPEKIDTSGSKTIVPPFSKGVEISCVSLSGAEVSKMVDVVVKPKYSSSGSVVPTTSSGSDSAILFR